MADVAVFIAASLDGFIAGPDDELDWLESGAEIEDTFTPFMERVGALLMGRRTYDVASGFDGPWPYGETPVLVATHRELSDTPETVQHVSGSIEDVVAAAKDVAGQNLVYIDGGQLIRAALDAGLVDEITVTVVPVILGDGIALFAGVGRRYDLDLVDTRPLGGGFIQHHYRVADTRARW